MRRSFPNSEPISRLKTFFELFSVWLDSMLPIYSFCHCEKQNAPLAVTLFNEMHTPPPPPPIYILFSPVILGGYHGIKEKKAWNAYSLTTGFIGIMPILTQPCIMCTLIQINPMSLSFNFTLCDGRFVNTPSAFYQGFKYYWWVLESLVRMSIKYYWWVIETLVRMSIKVLLLGCSELPDNVNKIL